MMKKLPAFFLCLLVFITSIPPMMGGNAINIAETCKQAPNYDECVWALETTPPDLQSDHRGLAVSSLMAAMDNASKTAEKLRDTMDDESDVFIQQCLNDCYDHYVDVVQQMEGALAIVSFDGTSDQIKNLVLAAIADIEACESTFKEQPGHKAVLTRENGEMYKLCSNALVFVKHLPAYTQKHNPTGPPEQAPQTGGQAQENNQENAAPAQTSNQTPSPVQKPAL